MKKKTLPASPAGLALAVFQPSPNVCYSLETTAHLADVPHRNILVYCRAGLLQPVAQAPYGVMVFTEEAVYTVHRIEHLRTVHANGKPCNPEIRVYARSAAGKPVAGK